MVEARMTASGFFCEVEDDLAVHAAPSSWFRDVVKEVVDDLPDQLGVGSRTPRSVFERRTLRLPSLVRLPEVHRLGDDDSRHGALRLPS